ncbi:hypothetical protein GIB67_025669 [Kingdonia uniflora]|uniref:Uncharacterized protein n=1 Tax=Kingdonia uniflora TaxID=39325 RepID=A0A7J7L8R8_9MAGN|nr:hypothetical protein GIB67_025669 [Kingdonia uniflora]
MMNETEEDPQNRDIADLMNKCSTHKPIQVLQLDPVKWEVLKNKWQYAMAFKSISPSIREQVSGLPCCLLDKDTLIDIGNTIRYEPARATDPEEAEVLAVVEGLEVERTVSSLKKYWSDMNRACKVYGTCLKSVIQGPISGMQQRNLDDAAKTMYEARGKGKWLYKEVYEDLSAHQCWKILQDQHPDTLARNVRMKQTSNSSPGTSTPTTPDTPVSSNNDSPVLVTDEETKCLGGIKNAKQKEMNKKR